MPDIYEGLDDQQRTAVRHGDTPLLIWAGPGSGKTSTLTRRVAHLVRERGIDPRYILVTTFTNRAAEEMKSRLEKLIGINVHLLAIGTTHSLCNRLIRRWGPDLVGLREHFSIYDDGDQKSVARDVVAGVLGIKEKKLIRSHAKAVVRAISFAKDCNIGPAYWPAFQANSDLLQFDLPMRELFTEYDRRLRKANAADFGDLQTLAVRLLRDNPSILAAARDAYRYVLVDEFQDLNPVQAELFSLLCKEHRRLSVVGDGNQAIFAFRASTPKFAMQFTQDWPDGTVVKLERNYRSTPQVVAASNAAIENNENRYALACHTDNPSGDPVRIVARESPQDEATGAVQLLRKYHDAGLPWREMAILARTHRSAKSYESALIDKSIPHRLHGSVGFFERAEIKDVLSWLRLCVNPADVESFKRACGSVPQRMGPTTVAGIVEFANAQALPILQAADRVRDIPGLRSQAASASLNFLARIARIKEFVHESTLVEAILDDTGYRTILAEKADQQEDEDHEDEVPVEERLAHLLTLSELYARHHESVPEGESAAASFLSNVVLDAHHRDPDADEVWVGTVHAAKGTEFDLVLVADCEGRIFPNAFSLSQPRAPAGLPEPDDDALEEERRLWYVAITRARRHLYLLWARSRAMPTKSWNGGSFMSTQSTEPSMFLAETHEGGAIHTRLDGSPDSASVPSRKLNSTSEDDFFGEPNPVRSPISRIFH